MRRVSIIVVLLLALVAISVVSAKDQAFRLDKSVNFISTNLSSAVCWQTGNILVVFNELKANDLSYGRIYSMLLKRKGNGTYAPTKVRLLSPNSGSHVRPSVAYLSQLGMFAVVWDNAGRSPTGKATKIIGQLVKANNGKPKKGNFDLVTTNAINVQPVVMNVREKPDSSPGGGNVAPGEVTEDNISFALIYTRLEVYNSSPANVDEDLGGLRIVPGYRVGKTVIRLDLDKNESLDKPISHEGYSLQAFAYKASLRWSYDSKDSDFCLKLTYSAEDMVPDGSVWNWQGLRYTGHVYLDQPKNQMINPDTVYRLKLGTYAPSSLLVSPKGVEPIGKLFISGSVEGFRKTTFEDGKLQKEEKLDIGGKVVWGADTVGADFGARFSPPPDVEPAAKPLYGYVIAATGDGAVYQQRVTEGGADLKKPKRIFTHGNKFQSMDVRRIRFSSDIETQPKENNVLILWQKKINGTKHEAWAYFTYLK